MIKKSLQQLQATSHTNLRLIFTFDEARSLLSVPVQERTVFYHFRHALSHLPQNGGVFVIVTDTISKISNFAPVAGRDSSQRVSKLGWKLYSPFYLLDTLDLFVDNDLKHYSEHQNPYIFFFRYTRVKNICRTCYRSNTISNQLETKLLTILSDIYKLILIVKVRLSMEFVLFDQFMG